jgi:hypothetical protein
MKDARLIALRVLWVTLPLTLGPLLGDALDSRGSTFRTSVSIALWAVWAVTVVASLIPRPETLTWVRIVVPAAVPAAVWATAAADFGVSAAIGLVAAGAVALAALLAPTGEAFVDGASYGDERRMPLRPPGALLLGPIELAWTVAVVGVAAGPLLLAAQQWAAGVIVTLIGFAVAYVAVRALHQLSRRWLVFVPAGFVVHDHLAVAEPTLFARRSVVALGVAAAGTEATDLTAGSLGPALQADLDEPITVVPASRSGRPLEQQDVVSFLFAPSRPGAALREAARRRLPVVDTAAWE